VVADMAISERELEATRTARTYVERKPRLERPTLRPSSPSYRRPA
jgi:hypothetical protein